MTTATPATATPALEALRATFLAACEYARAHGEPVNTDEDRRAIFLLCLDLARKNAPEVWDALTDEMFRATVKEATG